MIKLYIFAFVFGFIFHPLQKAYANEVSKECGTASHYGYGSRTASGQRFNPFGMFAAHKTLPFGTLVKVIHRRTKKSIQVIINDRGPFIRGRIIDLTTGAKRVLGMDGLAPVCLEVISMGKSCHKKRKYHRSYKH